MFRFDMWHSEKITDANGADCFFSDLDCVYRWNLYKDGKAIGDYSCSDSLEIEKRLSFMGFSFK